MFYTKYGKIGRAAYLIGEMEKDGYLESYCQKYGKDYEKFRAVAEFTTPFINGDYTELEQIRAETKYIKESERTLNELGELGFI